MTDNIMRKISVEKVTLNCGCGTDYARLEKSMKILERLTNRKPVKTATQLRIPTWGLRKGLQVGAKVTLRGKAASDILTRLLSAKDKQLKESSFDNNGNVAFGIHEYIDIPGAEYDPEIGIIGLQATITLMRPGFRIKRRHSQNRRISSKHTIPKPEAIEYAKREWGIAVKIPEETTE